MEVAIFIQLQRMILLKPQYRSSSGELFIEMVKEMLLHSYPITIVTW